MSMFNVGDKVLCTNLDGIVENYCALDYVVAGIGEMHTITDIDTDSLVPYNIEAEDSKGNRYLYAEYELEKVEG